MNNRQSKKITKKIADLLGKRLLDTSQIYFDGVEYVFEEYAFLDGECQIYTVGVIDILYRIFTRTNLQLEVKGFYSMSEIQRYHCMIDYLENTSWF